MPTTSMERQRKYRKYLYANGMLQITCWIRRKDSKIYKKFKYVDFTKVFKRITESMSEDDVSDLLNIFVKITRGKKEVMNLKEK